MTSRYRRLSDVNNGLATIVNTPGEKVPLLTDDQKKAVAIAGGAAGVPAFFYTRGLRREGVPLSRVPQVLKRDIASLGTHEVAPGKFVYGSLGGITETMRKGIGGSGGDIKHGASRAWQTLRGGWRGLFPPGGKKFDMKNERLVTLNSKLNDLIEFKMERYEFDPKKEARGAAVLAGAGLGTYGLYKRGASIPMTRHERTFYPKGRGISANIGVGAKSVFNQSAIGANLLRNPDVRDALIHDARSRMARTVGNLAKRIRP